MTPDSLNNPENKDYDQDYLPNDTSEALYYSDDTDFIENSGKVYTPEIEDIDYVAKILKKYKTFIQPYENANDQVRLWLETLQKDFKEQYHHNPIHNIQSRIKSLSSIAEKCTRKGIAPSFEAARDCLTDIAGTRVICYYIQDVYMVADILKKQTGTILLRESDYIKNPKSNGYRTYHLILGVSLHQSGQYYPVEIQIRTLAMDFWASMEHQLVYKSETGNREQLANELKYYADILKNMEQRMMSFYDLVQMPNDPPEEL